jgi:uncharacterized protein (DUF433 family)
MDMISVDRSRVMEDGIRAILSLRETVVLAEISEAKIRKDIENGFLSPLRGSESRHCFRWPDVFFLGAVYRSEFLTGGARQKVLRKLIETLLTPNYRYEYNSLCSELLRHRVWQKPSDLITRCNRMMIDATLFIDFDKVRDELTPRVDLYAAGLSRIEEKEGTLGGEAVFKNTRLSVRHVGKMSEGEPTESILLDYPYLRADDIQFARLYHEAHPAVGRPRIGAGAVDAANNP